MLGKNYLNDEVMVMGKVSSLRWSRKASRRRYPLSRGLKTEEELQVTRRICSLMKSVAHLCPLATHHLPCKLLGWLQVYVWFPLWVLLETCSQINQPCSTYCRVHC